MASGKPPEAPVKAHRAKIATAGKQMAAPALRARYRHVQSREADAAQLRDPWSAMPTASFSRAVGPPPVGGPSSASSSSAPPGPRLATTSRLGLDMPRSLSLSLQTQSRVLSTPPRRPKQPAVAADTQLFARRGAILPHIAPEIASHARAPPFLAPETARRSLLEDHSHTDELARGTFEPDRRPARQHPSGSGPRAPERTIFTDPRAVPAFTIHRAVQLPVASRPPSVWPIPAPSLAQRTPMSSTPRYDRASVEPALSRGARDPVKVGSAAQSQQFLKPEPAARLRHHPRGHDHDASARRPTGPTVTTGPGPDFPALTLRPQPRYAPTGQPQSLAQHPAIHPPPLEETTEVPLPVAPDIRATRGNRAQCNACGCWVLYSNITTHANKRCRKLAIKEDSKYWVYVEETESGQDG